MKIYMKSHFPCIELRQPIETGATESIAELPPFERKRSFYINLKNSGKTIEGNFRKDVVDFWTSIERRASRI